MSPSGSVIEIIFVLILLSKQNPGVMVLFDYFINKSTDWVHLAKMPRTRSVSDFRIFA